MRSDLMLAIPGGIHLAVGPRMDHRGASTLLPAAGPPAIGKAIRDTADGLRNWLIAQLIDVPPALVPDR